MHVALRSGRSCELRRVRAPFLRDYYALCFGGGEPTPAEAAEMFTFANRAGAALSDLQLGRPDAYTLIYSGHAARRARGWHLHLVLVPGRLAKAWLYLVLGGKNLLQALGLRRENRVEQGEQLVSNADLFGAPRRRRGRAQP